LASGGRRCRRFDVAGAAARRFREHCCAIRLREPGPRDAAPAPACPDDCCRGKTKSSSRLWPEPHRRFSKRDPYEALRTKQRQLSHALRGKRSRRALKARRALAQRHRKVANRRKNHVHQVTAKLIGQHALIVTEELSIGNMTASTKGTVDNPGNNVKQKAGFNRAILDTAPGSFVMSCASKRRRLICQVILLDPRRYRSSQTCPSCARVRKKALCERGHQYGCGFAATRDQAAALSMLVEGLKLLGREPAWAVRPETPSRAAETALDGSSS